MNRCVCLYLGVCLSFLGCLSSFILGRVCLYLGACLTLFGGVSSESLMLRDKRGIGDVLLDGKYLGSVNSGE